MPIGTFDLHLLRNDGSTLEATTTFDIDHPASTVSTFTTDEASYTPDESISVTWTNGGGSSLDWYGIRRSDTLITSAEAWVEWHYVPVGMEFDGGGSIGPRLPGEYLVEYLTANTYGLVSRANDPGFVPSIPVSVDFIAAADTPQGTLNTDKTTYAAYEPIVVDWTGMTTDPLDFVAIVPNAAPDDNMVAFEYTGGAAVGNIQLNLLLAGGDYDARFFTANTYNMLAEADFDVDWQDEDAPRVFVQATPVLPNVPIGFDIENFDGGPTAWVGAFYAGDPSWAAPIGWSYKPPVTDISGAIPGGLLAIGQYELRIYDSSDVMIDTDFFEIEPPSPSHSRIILDKPYSHQDFDTDVGLSWSSFDGHARDVLGLLPLGADPTDPAQYLEFQLTGGGTSGTATFAQPSQPGWYIIRGYRAYSFELYASSDPFPVYEPYVDPCPGGVVGCNGGCQPANYNIDFENEECFTGCSTPEAAVFVLDRDLDGLVSTDEWFPWGYQQTFRLGSIYDFWTMTADSQGLVQQDEAERVLLPCTADEEAEEFFCPEASEVIEALDLYAPAGLDVGELVDLGVMTEMYASTYAWFLDNAPGGVADITVLDQLATEVSAEMFDGDPCEPLCLTGTIMLAYFDGYEGLAAVDGVLTEPEWQQLAYYGPLFASFGQYLNAQMGMDQATDLTESQALIDALCDPNVCLTASDYDTNYDGFLSIHEWIPVYRATALELVPDDWDSLDWQSAFTGPTMDEAAIGLEMLPGGDFHELCYFGEDECDTMDCPYPCPVGQQRDCDGRCSDTPAPSDSQCDPGWQCTDAPWPWDDGDCLQRYHVGQLTAGELVISEIMRNPSDPETDREWVEAYNTTAFEVSLLGLKIMDQGSESHIMNEDIILQPGGYAVFGASDDALQNGGMDYLDMLYDPADFQLENTTDEVLVRFGPRVFDTVAYDGTFTSDADGVSLSLDPTQVDDVLNDASGNWCAGLSDYGDVGSELGTPGFENDPCGGPTCVDGDLGSAFGTVVATGDTTGAGDDHNGYCSDGSGPDVALLFRAPHDGLYEFDLDGSAYDTQLSLLGGCVAPELECDDNSALTPPASWLQVYLFQGEGVSVVIDGTNGESGAWQLGIRSDEYCNNGQDDDLDGDVDCDDPDCFGDERWCGDAGEVDCSNELDDDGDGDVDCDDSDCVLAPECNPRCEGLGIDLGSATGQVATGDTTGETNDFDEGCLQGMTNDVIYTWTAPSAGWWAFDTLTSNLDSALAVWPEDCAAQTETACNYDYPPGYQSKVTVQLASAEVVEIIIDGESGGTDSYVLNINPGEDCGDAIDNDGDGDVDCDDADCAQLPQCVELYCDDSIDNDGDGDTDCADDDCTYDPTCVSCAPIDLGSMIGVAVASGSIASEDDDALPTCGDPGAVEAEFTWTAPSTGVYLFDTTGSDYDSVVCVRSDNGECDGTEFACAAADGGYPARTPVTFWLEDETVVILIEGTDGTTGNMRLDIFPFEDCTDSIDNDQDGDTDCADADCNYDPGCRSCSPTDLGSALGTLVSAASTTADDDDLQPSCAPFGNAPDKGYTWTAPSEGMFRFDTIGANFDTVLELRANGDCTDAILGCNDQAPRIGGDVSQVDVYLMQDDMVFIGVDGYDGQSGAFDLTVSEVEDCINAADDDGDGDIDCADSDCDFEQWCVSCAATDLGSVMGTAVASGDTTGDDDDVDPTCASSASNDHEYTFTAPIDGTYVFNTDGSGFDTVLTVREDDCDGHELGCDDDGGAGNRSQVVTFVEGGYTVLLAVDGYLAASGAYQINIYGPEQCGNGLDEDNDGNVDCADPDCDYADECITCSPTILGSSMGPAVATGSTASEDDDLAPTCGSAAGSADAEFAFTAPTGGTYTIDTAGSAFDTILSVRGNTCNGPDVACDDDSGPGTTSSATFPLNANDVVLFAIDGYLGATGNYNVNIWGPEQCAGGVDEDDDGDIDCADSDCTYDGNCISCAPTNLGSTMGDAVASGTTAGGDDDMDPSCGTSNGAPDQEFTFTAPVDGTYTFNTDGSAYDTLLYIRDGTCAVQDIACDDSSAPGGQAEIEQYLQQDDVVLIGVDGDNGESGNYLLNLWGPEDCNNSNDDDGDGDIDCDDPDCATDPACLESDCNDSVDNDSDGDTDCADSDCTYDDACISCSPTDLGTAIGDAIATGQTTSEDDDFDASCNPGSGAKDVEFTWSPPADGEYKIDTVSSDFDTVLMVYEDGCGGNERECNDEGPTVGPAYSEVTMLIDVAETVLIVIDGYNGQEGNYTLNIQPVEECGDSIDNDNDGDTDCDDSDCTYDAECVTCDETYLGSATGEVATGDTFSSDDDIDPDCNQGGQSPDEEYRWTAPTSGRFRFDTFGSDFDTVLEVRDTTCFGELLDCNDQDELYQPQSMVDVDLGAGQDVVVLVDGYQGQVGNFVLNINEVEDCFDTVDNDGDSMVDCADSDCLYRSGCVSCNATDLGTATGASVASGSTASGSDDDMMSSCAVASQVEDEFTWTPPFNGTFVIETIGSDFDTVVSVRDTDCSGAELDCDDQAELTNQSRLWLAADTNDTYLISVDGYDSSGASVGSYVLNIWEHEDQCNDATDEDGDGDTDCADWDCAFDPACDETGLCGNALDDDGDGMVDCLDPDCRGACPGLTACADRDIGSPIGSLVTIAEVGALDNDLEPTCSALSGKEEALSFTVPFSGNYAFSTVGSYFDTVTYTVASNCTTEIACEDLTNFGEFHEVALTSGSVVNIVIDSDISIPDDEPDEGARYELDIWGENCTDTVDNDGDGNVDCDDLLCDGKHPSCP